MTKLLLFVIVFYQKVVSPHFMPRCRYYPTCSAYALEAVKTHGAFKGGFFAALRILRCNPFSKGGVDFVPQRNASLW